LDAVTLDQADELPAGELAALVGVENPRWPMTQDGFPAAILILASSR
jgi:hypothetical protein